MMIPLAEPNLSGNESKYLQNCITTNYVSSVGEYVNLFEKMVAEAAGTKYAVAVASGTCALHLALLAAGVKRGDLVIVPSFTFIASANAIMHAGAEPWLFDIRANDWTLDYEQVRSALAGFTEKRSDGLYHRATNKRVAAIMPVCTLGNVPDFESLNKIAAEFSLPLVTDAAPAIGAEYNSQKIGKFSKISCFSFNGNKTVTCGGGGAIVTDDESIAKFVRHVSTTARVGREYDHDMVGYNYRMTNLEAAVGCAQMEQLEKFLKQKSWIRENYQASLSSAFPVNEAQKNTFWFSGVLLPNLKAKDVVEELKKSGIQAGTFWKPVHLQAPFKNCPVEKMSVTESIWDRVLTLPSSTHITKEQINQVAVAVKSAMGAST